MRRRVLAILAVLVLLGASLVAQADPPRIFVVGEVAKPGVYPYTDGLTVGAAIDAAGGLLTWARGRLVVIRKVDGKDQRIEATRQTPMRAADQLVVP